MKWIDARADEALVECVLMPWCSVSHLPRASLAEFALGVGWASIRGLLSVGGPWRTTVHLPHCRATTATRPIILYDNDLP